MWYETPELRSQLEDSSVVRKTYALVVLSMVRMLVSFCHGRTDLLSTEHEDEDMKTRYQEPTVD